MKVLITTLGRARREGGDMKANVRGSYRMARYRFEGGGVSDPTPFFGLALHRHLIDAGVSPDKIVVFGTAGSMWDAWLEVDESLLMENAGLFGRLETASESANVTGTLLDELADVLQRRFGVAFICKLIPYGKDEIEQVGILNAIADCISEGDELYLDVTHGFRHLPMLEMMSAFLLKHRLDVDSKGLYYGALDMTEGGVTPVVCLNGLLSLHHWIEAIAILEFTGNVAALARLPELISLKNDLNRYQFLQQMNNVAEAKKVAAALSEKLRAPGLPSSVMLFQSSLLEFFAWGIANDYSKRQYAQSKAAYRCGDYLRAVILLTESVISSRVRTDRCGDMMNYDAREQAKRLLDDGRSEGWFLLRNLRNALAHGARPEGRTAAIIQRMLSSEEAFCSEMDGLYQSVMEAWAEP